MVGIGTFSSSFLTRNDILSAQEQEQLTNSYAVGDIVLQFLDEHGFPVETEITKRLIHIDIMKAREKAGHIIGIAQGVERKQVLRGVLKRRLVDTLFIDVETAQALLDS